MGTSWAPRRRRAPDRPGWAVAWLSARLTRWSTLAILAGAGAYMVVESLAFTRGYPDEASRAALRVWGLDPGIRIISGPATAVQTLGGFVVWDSGLLLTLVLGAWALTTTTRVLRGDEDAGRSDTALSGPIRATSALAAQLVVLLGMCVAIGTVIGASLVLCGAELHGSLLFGAAVTGYSGTVVGMAAVACQILPTRSGALRASGSALGVLILLRMVSNSATSREWLGWLTPLGWTDQLRAYGDNRWPVLVIPLIVTAALAGVAVLLRGHRDTGTGLVHPGGERRSSSWGTGNPMTFAWRTNQGVLLAWAAGVSLGGFVVGMLLRSVDDYLGSDPSYRDILTTMGMNPGDLTLGFVGLWAVILGLVISVYTAFRMGAARAEEASTQVEQLLTRPLRRASWLGAHVVNVIVSAILLCLAASTALWVGAVATDGEIAAGDAFAAIFNTLPVVVLFAGLSVLVFGVAPRLTIAVGAAAPVTAYILQIVGPLLRWPGWVVDLSPFHHLEAVPVDPFGLTAAVVLTCVGVALAIVGLLAFRRRDIVGA